LFLTAALAAPGVAAAKPGDRDFQQTFPVASRVCEKHADNQQVAEACDALHAAYDAAVAAAPSRDALEQAIEDAKTSVQSACQGEDRSGCRAAIQSARSSVRSARQAYREAVRGYHEAIQTARKEFWTAVKGLGRQHAAAPLDS
jgi:hypothetical protein